MIIECPDCSGKVPDTEKECPFCGCILDIYTLRAPHPEDEDTVPETPQKKVPKKSFIALFFRRIFELILFLIICCIIVLTVLLTDFMGARTSLRQMCMTDSGSGSDADPQVLRVEIKHYILVGLDLIDGGGTGTMTVQPGLREPDQAPRPTARRKVERKPLELPPEPPEEDRFQIPEGESVTVPTTVGDDR